MRVIADITAIHDFDQEDTEAFDKLTEEEIYQGIQRMKNDFTKLLESEGASKVEVSIKIEK